jgi:aspartate-semialdehyde dehydrogenase
VVAHPAAIVLALLLARIKKAGKIENVVATVFQPASEHSQKGMDELHEQTVNLLSFQTLPKKVFDTQVAFNMVARYGEQSAPSLAAIENRIRMHYERISGPSVLPISLRLLQAPVFHAHAFLIYVRLTEPADLSQLAGHLACDHVVLSHSADDAPSNVSAAGQNDILASLSPDEQQPNAFWLWAAVDNLRIAAVTAVECAEAMASSRPKGKVQ